VIRAGDGRTKTAATFVAQLRATVLTDVVVRAQFAFAVAHNEDALVANFYDEAIADVGELLGTTNKVPALGKYLFHFVSENRWRYIFITREALAQALNVVADADTID
jgi:hypothetical protein